MKRRITAVLSAVCIALLSFRGVYAGEQLGATDFDDGVGLPWHIVESATGKMDFEIEDGVYRITIINPGGASNGGEDRWDCQFRHRGLRIVAGHEYRVHYEITPSNAGKYYTKIGNLDGNVEIWHNMSNGYDLDATWDPINIGAGETKVVDLTFTASQSLDVAEWAFHLGGDGQYTNGVCFPAGTVIEFDNMSLIDLTSDENDYIEAEPWVRSDILLNQVGYFAGCAKRATLLSDSSAPVPFSVTDSSGNTVFEGQSIPFGFDPDSEDNVHILDFSGLDQAGTYTISTSEGESYPFSIGDNTVYSAMLYDGLNYFYQNRSGIAIESSYITSGDVSSLARPAGHPSDIATVRPLNGYSASSGSQDVTGGWYDAGDHGKYVVNGGIALWMLQNRYESALATGTEAAFADGTMAIPENGNGYPDLLDEARWEMEWMFRMLVTEGDCRDMVYHKVHDEKWTGLGLSPADDDLARVLLPPSTAATLNVSACAAQAARLWNGIDNEFAQECVDIAIRTYNAALSHPDMYAPLDDSNSGGGAYGDTDVTDEFYWAASELYITTGDPSYLEAMEDSQWYLAVPTDLSGGESVNTFGSFDWGHTAALGTMSVVLNGASFDSSVFEQAKRNMTAAADYYVAAEASQGYGQPYGQSTLSYNNSNTGYIWGSNSFVADNAVIMSYAYILTGDGQYIDGAIGGLDYLLGRNPMDYSYVTGYGYHSVMYPHHRYWANLIDPSFPLAPSGVMVGGPNVGLEDPWVRGMGWHYGDIAPAKAYLDHIEAYSVNECTINWNAPLVWLVSFVTENSGGITPVDHTSGSSSHMSYDPQSGDAPSSGEQPPVVSNIQRNGDPVMPDPAASTPAPEDGSRSWLPVAIISVVALLALISVEVFVFKLLKMKTNK
ncbi:MAG: glycoside hydrolase family 9 protein [Clostridiales bacterium]|nr:glycoside hydrolase family 9 protein [Clostridiales bacterium]